MGICSTKKKKDVTHTRRLREASPQRVRLLGNPTRSYYESTIKEKVKRKPNTNRQKVRMGNALEKLKAAEVNNKVLLWKRTQSALEQVDLFDVNTNLMIMEYLKCF